MTRQTLDGSGKSPGHDPAHETIHSHDAAAPAAPPASKAKVCVVCGANVAGHRRYKDGAGRYYCEECFNAQTGDAADDESGIASPPPAPAPARQQTVTCPDCKAEVAPDALVEFRGTKVCEKCVEKRESSARREAARIAAAEEEALRQEKQKKMWFIIAAVVVGLLAVYGIFRFTMG